MTTQPSQSTQSAPSDGRPDLGGEPVTPQQIAADPLLREIAEMLSYLDLHLGRYQWKVLTTRQKELFADFVDADGIICLQEDPNYLMPGDTPRKAPRWWRDDYRPDED